MSENYSRQNLFRSEILPFLITITSLTAAGKTSLMKALKVKFESGKIKMNFISAGGIMRDIAKESGFLSIEAFAKHNRDHPEDGYDLECDNRVRKIGEKDHQVIEGRLPHIFVPKGFHILLRCPLEVRAWRRYEWQNPDELSLNDVMWSIAQRDDDDQLRYETLYPGCIWADSDFNLIIDSSIMTIDEEVRAIILGWRKWLVRNNKLIRRS